MRIWIDPNSIEHEIKKLSSNVDVIKGVIVREIAQQVYAEWVKQTMYNLHTTRDKYIEELSITQTSEFVFEVGIQNENSLAGKIEGGSPPFDMKIGFQNSSKKVSTKKGGWYLTIPFKIGTPSTSNTSGQFSSVMPRSVYNAVREAIRNNKPVNLPNKYSQPLKPHHKSPIFAGIKSTQHSGGNRSYSTFRRVSDKSDPRAWIHPGFQARNIMDRVIGNISVDQIISNILRNFT